ncbi:hypothetical protein WJX79_008107 [Trebouxia sp. C0005]
MGIYLIASNAAGSPGDRGYSLVTGLVLPTLAMLQGFYDLLIEAKSAADQNICSDGERFKPARQQLVCTAGMCAMCLRLNQVTAGT